MPKLSELIRKGAQIRPQAKNSYFDWNEQDDYTSCAWGAAIEAVYPDAIECISDFTAAVDAVQRLCDVGNVYLVNPFTGGDDEEILFGVIADLNDHHGWTREQIADWLESEGY